MDWPWHNDGESKRRIPKSLVKTLIPIIAILALFIPMTSTSIADIHSYTDEDGIAHYTNVKNDPRFRKVPTQSTTVAAMTGGSTGNQNPLGNPNNPGGATGYNSMMYAQTSVGDVTNFTDSPWFALLTGLASVGGLILALYPVQIRGLPPSVFRSLLWQRILLISFGCGFTVIGAIQFYRQDHPPLSTPFAMAHLFLKGFRNIEQYDMDGPFVWVAVFFLGVITFAIGSSSNPARTVSSLAMDEIRRIDDHRAKHVQHTFEKSDYESLNESQRELHDQILQSYRLLQSRVIDMYSGGTPISLPQDDMRHSIMALQVDDLRQKIAGLVKRVRKTPKE